MKNQTINIYRNTTIAAIGQYNSAHTKAVVCKETGDVFSSVKDAAKENNVSYPMMSGHLCGRYKSCKGKHYAYLRDILNNPDCMLAQLRDTNAELERRKEVDAAEAERRKADAEDARKWREYCAEQERIRREEERRLEAEHRAKADLEARIEKLSARHERLTERASEAYEKANRINEKRLATEAELAALIAELAEMTGECQ